MAIEQQNDTKLQYYLTNIQPHIDIAATMTDDQVLIKRIDRHKSATYTEYLQQRHTLYPLIANGTENKLTSYHSQSKQGWE